MKKQRYIRKNRRYYCPKCRIFHYHESKKGKAHFNIHSVMKKIIRGKEEVLEMIREELKTETEPKFRNEHIRVAKLVEGEIEQIKQEMGWNVS